MWNHQAAEAGDDLKRPSGPILLGEREPRGEAYLLSSVSQTSA